MMSLCLALALLAGFACAEPAGFSFTRQRLFPGYDGAMCKALPSVATDGRGMALMSYHELKLSGSDEVYGIFMTRSTDNGRSWGTPVRQEALKDAWEGTNRWSRSAVTLHYNHRHGRWFAVGHEMLYLGGHRVPRGRLDGRPVAHPVVFDVDASAGKITGCRRFSFPFEYDRALPFGQIVEGDNGEFILPFYYMVTEGTERKCRSVTVRYAFEGDSLRVVAAGEPIEVPGLSRVVEPSLAWSNGTYYLTLRSDQRGLYAESADGLRFSEPRPWVWEDGTEIGNRNTQQHWMIGKNSLYLAYTRERPDNGHVFRHRAPIFMARFDPARKCLLRETEVTLVPELGARLGNFCCIAEGNVAWLVTAEWMQSWGEKVGVCDKYGSDNSIWLVKVDFAK